MHVDDYYALLSHDSYVDWTCVSSDVFLAEDDAIDEPRSAVSLADTADPMPEIGSELEAAEVPAEDASAGLADGERSKEEPLVEEAAPSESAGETFVAAVASVRRGDAKPAKPTGSARSSATAGQTSAAGTGVDVVRIQMQRRINELEAELNGAQVSSCHSQRCISVQA